MVEGVDRIVFTGGIGANAAPIRQAICIGLHFLGVEIDSSANASHARTISSFMSSVRLNVIQTNKEAVIASRAAAFLDEER